MERHFDLELADLKKTLLTMSAMVEETINRAVSSLEKLSPELAREVISADESIDRIEIAIDDKTFDLIIRHQPLAGDLRLILMAGKIGTELERIADLAVDIAQRTLKLAGQPLIKPLVDIPKLSSLAQQMVRDSIQSFVNLDVTLARSICKRDDEADSLRDAVYRELSEIVRRDGGLADRAIPLILVSRHLERICDHATNIAEDVVFLVEAKFIKHCGK
ncbi:MAG: phosphate signaling complex protein PhoU [Candidatus Ratteibacteria bacterium]|jgi:phosphate transport system protein